MVAFYFRESCNDKQKQIRIEEHLKSETIFELQKSVIFFPCLSVWLQHAQAVPLSKATNSFNLPVSQGITTPTKEEYGQVLITIILRGLILKYVRLFQSIWCVCIIDCKPVCPPVSKHGMCLHNRIVNQCICLYLNFISWCNYQVWQLVALRYKDKCAAAAAKSALKQWDVTSFFVFNS